MTQEEIQSSAKKNFANFLRNSALQNDKYTINDLSKFLDISAGSLAGYGREEDLPSTQTLLRLSSLLNVSIDQMLGRDVPDIEVEDKTFADITVDVSRVIDGDTFCFMQDGKEVKVRLIGVDTPESVHPKKEKNSEEGIIVSDYVKTLIEGKTLEIRFDISQYDFYGRMLGYVYLEDGTFLNEHLLAIGYAKTANYAPNTKFKEYFKKVEKEYNEKENND